MPKYLDLIRSGDKTVEGRIRAGKWADVIPGDTFNFISTATPQNEFECSGNEAPIIAAVRCRATSVRHYDCYQDMLEGEGLEKCLPGVTSLEAGVEVYRSIPGYREREREAGVVAVGLELIEG